MRRLFILLGIGLILTVLYSCDSSIIDDINPKLIAKVDNHKIYIDKVKKRIYQENEKNVKLTKPIILYYLKEIIKETIIEDEFKKVGLKITKKDKINAPFLAKLKPDELKRWLILKKLKAYVVRKVTPPSERECRYYYKKHIDDFKNKERVNMEYIIFEDKKQAEQFFNIAKKKGFDTAIKEEKVNTTFRGVMSVSDMPEDILEKVNIEKDNSLWLVQSENKYFYVIYIIKFYKTIIPFKEVEDEISKKIFEDRRAKLFTLWLNNQIKKRKIKIYYNKLD